jgi:hypothetical protein
VRKGPDCWLWRGNTNGRYGVMSVGHNENVYAHRFAWTSANGTIPHGQFVLHHCDRPRCVRPEHLFLGTQRDNLDDCANKGRRRGRCSPPERRRSEWLAAKAEKDRKRVARARLPWAHSLTANKLTISQVRAIKYGLSRGETRTQLAKRFGVHYLTIHAIYSGRCWRSV